MRGFVCFLLLFTGVLFGQGTTSRAVGTVQDASGSVVAGATVRLTHEGTSAVFTTSTSDAGAYVFEAVQPGVYTVSVEAPGFKKFSARGNLVSIGQPMTVNVRLEVGAVTESVEVSGAYEAVQTSTSGNYGNLFSEQVIRDLPIVGTRGRNPLDLVTRQPGVVSGANTGGGVHVHGARDRAWNYTLDGIDTNETSAGGSNFSPLRANPDSLAEFRVLTSNFTAEYGRNSGAQVAMITRSGSNDLHGTGFWFYRTPRLNANEWENNLNRVGKRQFVQHILGGSAGGPIRRNRTFVFANLQELRARESAVANRTVYTAEARRGLLRYVRGGRNTPAGTAGATVDSSGNVLPGRDIGTYGVAAGDPERIGLNSTVQSWIAQTPLPNNFTGGDGLNTALFTFPALQREKQYDATFKIDHILNERNTVYARIAFGSQDTNCDRVNGGSEFFPGAGCVVNTVRRPRNYAFNWRWNPAPAWTNELVFGRNFFFFDFFYPTTDLSKPTFYGPVDIPETHVWGNKRALTTWQFVDNVAHFRGAHSYKFGTNVRLQKHVDTRGSVSCCNVGQEANFSTGINTVDPARFGIPVDINTQFDRPAFQSHINFLLGRVGSITRSFVAEGDKFVNKPYDYDARFPELDFYLQDTWKLRKNLTLDLGLRWETKLAPRNPDGRISVPDQLITAGARPSDTLRWKPGSLYGNDYNNLSPSLGIVWDPKGNGRMAVRANYRIAYDRINTFVLSSSVFQSLPGTTFGLTYPDFGQAGGRLSNLPTLQPPTQKPSELAQPAAFGTSLLTVVDPAFRSPETHQWSLGIQREIASRTVVEVSYIGRRAYNLFGAYNVNQAEIFRNAFLGAFNVVKAGGESDLMNRLVAPDTRRNSGESGSAMIRRLFSSDLQNNAVASIASSLGNRIQGGRSLSDLAGLGPFFFFPFPQFAGGLRVIDSNDFSTYHALETQIERRFHNGFTYQLSYTWAKSLDTRSFDPAFTTVSGGTAQSGSSTPFDLSNRKLNYARSDFDRRHVVQSFWVYELPFGKGRKFGASLPGALERMIGGWQVAGLITMQSGRPFTIYATNTLSSVIASPANCSGCTRKEGGVFDDPSQGLKFYFDADTRAKFALPGSIPVPGALGNTGRNAYSGPGGFFMDASFLKRTRINERFNFEVRADMTNVLNTPVFGFPTAVVTSTIFGRIRDSVDSSSRKIQLGAKLNF
ncbi:MAG: TonB-dependent receptor [Acidobacteria bacterium]|nr:TonB-dependent receptor [Acidobacteriota bacterium]